jgi:hypothetical protein
MMESSGFSLSLSIILFLNDVWALYYPSSLSLSVAASNQ